MTIAEPAPDTLAAVEGHVLRNTYRDSVELMRVAAELERLPDIQRAALVMGTPANRAILEEAGLLFRAARDAGPNDLVIAAGGVSEVAVATALERARTLLTSQPTSSAPGASDLPAPRTIAEGLAEQPTSRLAMISLTITKVRMKANTSTSRRIIDALRAGVPPGLQRCR